MVTVYFIEGSGPVNDPWMTFGIHFGNQPTFFNHLIHHPISILRLLGNFRNLFISFAERVIEQREQCLFNDDCQLLTRTDNTDLDRAIREPCMGALLWGESWRRHLAGREKRVVQFKGVESLESDQ